MRAVDCELHFTIVIMLPDVVHVSQMLSQSSTDFEYLRRSQGSVFLHNVLTKNSTEFLSKDKFVSFQSVIWRTSSAWKWHKLPNLCGCGCTCATEFYFSPPQGEKEADDYKLSADHRYVAFISNYSKVDSFQFNAKISVTVSYKVFYFCLISCGGILSRLHTHFTTETLSKCYRFPHFCACMLLSVTYNLCWHQSVWKHIQYKLWVLVMQI